MGRWRHLLARRRREETEMNHGKILARAWTLVWHSRALWLFGFLFALAGGGGSFSCPQSGSRGAAGVGGGAVVGRAGAPGHPGHADYGGAGAAGDLGSAGAGPGAIGGDALPAAAGGAG